MTCSRIRPINTIVKVKDGFVTYLDVSVLWYCVRFFVFRGTLLFGIASYSLGGSSDLIIFLLVKGIKYSVPIIQFFQIMLSDPVNIVEITK